MNPRVRDLPVLDINKIFNNLFFSWPTETKPPIESFPLMSDGVLSGWEIQMALAGFKEEDLKVWHEERVLYIKGSNIERDVADRFKCNFAHKIPCSLELDLVNASVSFADGILRITIPTANRETNRVYLLGSS